MEVEVPLSICYPDMMRRCFLKRHLTAACSKVREVRHIVVHIGSKEAGLGACLARQS